MRTICVVICLVISSCGKSEKVDLYEISIAEQFQVETPKSQSEPYYWELINPEGKPSVKLESRIYSEKFSMRKLRTTGIETWTFQGTKMGEDTLKLYLKAYQEDSLNIPAKDSLIIFVKVNEKL